MSETYSDVARALGRIPSGLFIVTAGTGSQATGFLASFVQQVGFEPPVLTVSVKGDRHVAALIREHKAFCVSVLHDDSKGLLGHFARGFEPGAPAFEGVAIDTSAAGVPFPTDALANLHCKLVGEGAWTDHVLFAGEVVDGRCGGDAAPMVHTRKNGLNY